MSQDDLSILPSSQAKSHSVGQAFAYCTANSHTPRCSTHPESGWELLLARAGCSKLTQPMTPGKQKVNTSHSQLLQTWFTGKASGSTSTPLTVGELRTALVLQGQLIHPGGFLHSPVILLQMWAGIRLNNTATIATHPKNCYWNNVFVLPWRDTLKITLGNATV